MFIKLLRNWFNIYILTFALTIVLQVCPSTVCAQETVTSDVYNDKLGIYKLSVDGKYRTRLIRDDVTKIVAVKDGWIYYIINEDELFRARVNGKQINRITQDKINICGDSSSVIIYKEWVYYSNATDKNRLYKIKTDGTKKTRLNNDHSIPICINNNWVFYYYYNYDKDESMRIFRIRTDGSGKKQLTYTRSVLGYISDGWIYYNKMDTDICGGSDCEGGDLYKMKLDGSGNTRVIKDFAHIREVSGNWIYYMIGPYFIAEYGYEIHKVTKYGKQKNVLVKEICWNFVKHGDWIYYASADYSNQISCLKKIDTNGKRKKTLIKNSEGFDEGMYSDFRIYNNRIYYNNIINEERAFFSMDLDGGNKLKLVDKYWPRDFEVDGYWMYLVR